jgi:uncharacterized protein YutE (UPF0331/DUF86 family)/predicted nucleotidyltransferase
MAGADAALIEAATRALMPLEGVRLAYLFGSRSRGAARPDSDLDIAVAYASDADLAQREILRRQLVAALTDALGAVGERADVVDLEHAPSEIAFAAIRATRLLARSEEERVRHEVRVARFHDDDAVRREQVVDHAGVVRRLDDLNAAIGHLQAADAADEASLRSQALLRAATERWMQIAIESCIDLAFHVLADRGLPAPPSGRAAFGALAMQGVLEVALAERLGNAVSMRNVLVHDYVAVDLSILARAVREDLVDLESFASAIGRLL